MRVLLISHTCQSRTEGQPKARCLAGLPGMVLRVVVPTRWKRYGQWRTAEPALDGSYDYTPLKVRWPWIGPAQTYLHHYPQLRRVLSEFQPDVIDLWEEPWSLVSVQACRLRQRVAPQARVVTETEQNIHKVLPPPFEWFRRYTLAEADYLVGRSREAVHVAQRCGYEGPADVVPNAVDTDLFGPMDREACRRRNGLDGFVVGYVGRLVEAKGVSDLLGAIAGQRHRATLLLVGDGPDRALFEREAAERGIADRVRFLGSQPLPALPELINAMDTLVLPSRTTPSWKEQYGRVIIEAHACAVPVVGSDSGAIADVVGDGGRVVPERSPEALAAALDELAGSPADARRLGQQGRQQALETCTWQRVAERMHRIYHATLDESSSKRDAPSRALEPASTH